MRLYQLRGARIQPVKSEVWSLPAIGGEIWLIVERVNGERTTHVAVVIIDVRWRTEFFPQCEICWSRCDGIFVPLTKTAAVDGGRELGHLVGSCKLAGWVLVMGPDLKGNGILFIENRRVLQNSRFARETRCGVTCDA